MSGLAADHAWGEHAVGYGTGAGTSERSRPHTSSGQPAMVRGRQVEQPLDNLPRPVVKAVPGEPGRRDHRVVGPDRPAVV